MRHEKNFGQDTKKSRHCDRCCTWNGCQISSNTSRYRARAKEACEAQAGQAWPVAVEIAGNGEGTETMTLDEIKKMVADSGCVWKGPDKPKPCDGAVWNSDHGWMVPFSYVEAETDRCVANERDACARILEMDFPDSPPDMKHAAYNYAHAIRSRGKDRG